MVPSKGQQKLQYNLGQSHYKKMMAMNQIQKGMPRSLDRYAFESDHFRERDKPVEQRASSGNVIGLAAGPLSKPRYINPKIEAELVDFKKEIEEKFAKSPLLTFTFPRRSTN